MLICKHRKTDLKEVITFDIKNKFIVQQIAHMFAVCPSNVLTFGLIKTSLRCSVLNAVIPATRRGVFCILNDIV